MQALPSTVTAGYIRVDGKPAKQALSTWISKWIYLYTSHLQGKVRACSTSSHGMLAQPQACLLTRWQCLAKQAPL